MQRILFFLFILSYSILFSQIDKKLLDGEWIVYKKELKDGSTYFSQNKSFNPHKIYVFKKNKFYIKEYVTDENSFLYYPLKIEDNNILTFDNPSYTIEKLTANELVLLDINVKKIEKIFVRYYLKRYDYQRDIDLTHHSGKDILITTPTLSPYPKQDIFEKDFKSENEISFKTKGYLLFNLEKGSIETFFTDKIEVSEQNQNKIREIFNSSFSFWDFSKVKGFNYIKLPFVIITYKYKIQNNIHPTIAYGYNINDYEDIQLPLDSKNIDDGEKFYKMALQCFENKNYTCSLQNFKNSFEQNKYNLDAHYNYASINLALGKKEEACKKWKELIGYGQKEAEKEYQQNNCTN